MSQKIPGLIPWHHSAVHSGEDWYRASDVEKYCLSKNRVLEASEWLPHYYQVECNGEERKEVHADNCPACLFKERLGL